VFFHSYLTMNNDIFRFIWANKRHVIVSLLMFLVSGAMYIWDVDNIIAEAIVHRLPLQSVGSFSWSNWSIIFLFLTLLAGMVLAVCNQRRHRVINLNRVGRVRR